MSLPETNTETMPLDPEVAFSQWYDNAVNQLGHRLDAIMPILRIAFMDGAEYANDYLSQSR